MKKINKNLSCEVKINRKLALKQKIFMFLVRYFIPLIFRLWGKSLRITIVNNQDILKDEEKKESLLYACWHGRLFINAMVHRDKGIYILVSPSLDGDYATHFIHKLGYNDIRGDKRYGGAKAIKDTVRILKSEKSVGIMPDGPLGPGYKANLGAAVISKLSGKKIYPVGNNARWKITFNKSWDKFILPLPFSKCVLCYGPSIMVPQHATSEQIDQYTEQLENSLNELDAYSLQYLGLNS